LAGDGVLNPHPDAIRDPLFTTNPFFDPRDLVQVRYEMVRRHDADGVSISDAAASFGVSRPTFYKAQSTLAASGLAGLVPRSSGPKDGHKLSAKVVAFVTDLKATRPGLTTPQCLVAIEAQFGVKVHRRSLERALARKKKPD
jgi:transposase